jgi:hypothetical protein
MFALASLVRHKSLSTVRENHHAFAPVQDPLAKRNRHFLRLTILDCERLVEQGLKMMEWYKICAHKEHFIPIEQNPSNVL